MATLVLEQHEKETAVCRKVTEYLNDELGSLRSRNDEPMSPDDTAAIRGRIKFIKDTLKMLKAETRPA